MFRYAQHDKIPCVIASKAKQSNVYKIRIMGILCLLVATLARCARSQCQEIAHTKISIVMLSVSETSLRFHAL